VKIGIVGIGLIGASLGWDFRQIGHHVVGVSRQQTTCEIAKGEGICDRASQDLATLKDTEIVFICTPIASIITTARAVRTAIETILTDTLCRWRWR
jgi:arogenate dehydrogenase (NADP+)